MLAPRTGAAATDGSAGGSLTTTTSPPATHLDLPLLLQRLDFAEPRNLLLDACRTSGWADEQECGQAKQQSEPGRAS